MPSKICMGDNMDNKNKKDPYNFAKTEEGLKKRFRLISAKREEYKKKENKKTDGNTNG